VNGKRTPSNDSIVSSNISSPMGSSGGGSAVDTSGKCAHKYIVKYVYILGSMADLSDSVYMASESDGGNTTDSRGRAYYLDSGKCFMPIVFCFNHFYT
jgi:hypothetical protein